ncbi:peptidoglycan-binding protein LysM [Geotalea uraniireducens]|uniref:Peptidoglycan-binding protein LysM n=1 Tax=Geotalea uraniireducens TaxID=351604 RepID=A0ABM8EGD5_9BACT|nr:LysM peptidoglycan-binding domain-containing protein [Geotalea uraniireducens]BDV41339.1 peptidoglycan-binding protein LysM [Geotalea uraniireducens]
MSGKLRYYMSSLILTLALGGQAYGGDYLLYAPEPSQGKKPASPEEGVLVQSITIEKGDTLYSLSRKYNGRGGYYPQILLFNEIKNPNLIYAGNSLLVPVAPAEGRQTVQPRKAASAAEAAKRPRSHAGRKLGRKDAGTAKAPKTVTTVAPPASRAGVSPSPVRQSVPARPAEPPKKAAQREQTLYEQGIEAYKTGNYRQSLEAFDLFLQRYPDSPLVPDVSLYRADTMLKLSNQQ